MRQAIIIFLVGFLVFGTLGFIAAKDQVGKPEDIKKWAFHPVELIRNDEAGTSLGLVYKHDDHIIYHFDIDSDHLEKFDAATRADLEQGPRGPLKFPVNRGLIMALLGGPVAGYNLKNLSAKSDSTVKRNKIAGILGAISGFSLGFKIGTVKVPGAESPEVREVLDIEGEWCIYERAYYKMIASNTFHVANFIENLEAANKYKQMAVDQATFADNAQDIKSVHFITAAEVFNNASTLAAASIKNISDISNIKSEPLWLRWWWIGALLPLAVFLGIMGVMWVSEQRSERKANARPPDPEL